MHPRSSLKFLCLFGILLWLAIIAPTNSAAFFTSAQAQPNVVITLGATNNSPKAVNETVTLTATVNVDASKLTFRWQFGDGQTAEGQVVHHLYVAEGDYTAVVIASNGID